MRYWTWQPLLRSGQCLSVLQMAAGFAAGHGQGGCSRCRPDRAGSSSCTTSGGGLPCSYFATAGLGKGSGTAAMKRFPLVKGCQPSALFCNLPVPSAEHVFGSSDWYFLRLSACWLTFVFTTAVPSCRSRYRRRASLPCRGSVVASLSSLS